MTIVKIDAPVLQRHGTGLDVLRLDLLHPQISGNKWFKLKYNLAEADKQKKKILLSFGGAYSNHLHALAYAGKINKFNTIGFVRGEKVMNDTLRECETWGMELHFISRQSYRQKYEPAFLNSLQNRFPEAYIIPEGGNNVLGLAGCGEILNDIDLKAYDIIACAVGTGTTFTGMIESSLTQNKVMGFSAIAKADYLFNEIRTRTKRQNWELISGYHFGGFAKRNDILLDFMLQFKEHTAIELDFIYTAKMMFGIFDMAQNHGLEGQRILAVHTGGIQGNRGLI